MGVREIVGREPGDEETTKVVPFCSSSGWAIGPIFDSWEAYEGFVRFFEERIGHSNLRSVPEQTMRDTYSAWCQAGCPELSWTCPECGAEGHGVHYDGDTPVCEICDAEANVHYGSTTTLQSRAI